MAENVSQVYQFKITLKGTKPPIWRRIQVPQNYTFEWLSFAILHSMGWWNEHLHEFRIKNPQTGEKDTIGVPNDDGFEPYEPVEEKEAKIADYFLQPKDKALYTYDFGDGWDHDVVLEKIIPAAPDTTYPKCIAGKRACPPENVGGVGGYEELLEIIADPTHPEYENKMSDLAMNAMDSYDPNKFDSQSIFEDGWKQELTLEDVMPAFLLPPHIRL